MEDIRGAVLPSRPTGGKIALIATLEFCLKKDIPVVEVWRTNEDPPDEVLARWEHMEVRAFDIGSEKYHKIGASSALDAFFKKIRVPADGAFGELSEMLARNNRTGYLKQGAHRIFKILRDAYEIGDDQLGIIERSKHVFRCWYSAYDCAESFHAFEEIECVCLWKRVCDNEMAFSIAEYMVNMRVLGVPEAEIAERAGYFYGVEKRAETARREAEARWQRCAVPHKRFPIALRNGNELTGIALDADDVFVVRAAWGQKPRPAVVISRNSRGNVIIIARGFSLERVHREIMAVETVKSPQPIWFRDQRNGIVSNGTVQLDRIAPTGIGFNDIVSVVSEHLRPMNK